MKTTIHIFCLLISISISPFINGQTVVLDNQVFYNDTTINAERIVCKQNGKIRVKNGKTLTLNCTVIEVQTNFTIDARGEAGLDGAPMGDWETSPSGGFFGRHDAHAQFETSKYDGVTGGAKGNDGRDGGNGGSIYINFTVYQGQSGGLGSLICMTDGGVGGRGGKGITLHCTDHTNETFTKPSGNNGKNGLPGKYSYTFVKQ